MNPPERTPPAIFTWADREGSSWWFTLKAFRFSFGSEGIGMREMVNKLGAIARIEFAKYR